MLQGRLVGAIAVIAALCVPLCAADAFDDSKYPNFKGQWIRDVSRGAPIWPAKEAPLTPEYQAIYAENLKNQAEGGPSNWPSTYCIPQGMPAMMNLFDPMEIVITPETTYILISHINDSYRRIFTDGREWPSTEEVEPTYAGYSIGRWVDEDGDGRFDVLEVETRNLAGPRAYDVTGLPLHRDNQTIIKERIYLDKTNPNVLYDDITVIDHALTRPWTLQKKAVRNKSPRPVWPSDLCNDENNSMVRIGNETYFRNTDRLLMPVKKGQNPPDLRFFNQTPPK
jgi:hypothetical protein